VEISLLVEAIEVLDEILLLGVINDEEHTIATNLVLKRRKFNARLAASFALIQSISDVMRVSGNYGFDEEHITASLTGSLTANLTWFAKSYRRIGGTETLPAFRWVHQTKQSEARSGIDFGILARVPGGTSARAWRLVVIQAKVGRTKGLKIAIDHETNSEGKPKPELTDEASEIFAVAARTRAARAFVMSPAVRRAITIANKGFSSGERRYQLETILRTDLRGRVLARTNRDWCFYAAWFPQHDPLVIDVRALAAATLAVGPKNSPTRYSFQGNPLAFKDMFMNTIFAPDSPYGIVLSDKLVGDVVDDLLETAPEIRLLMACADGRLDYNLNTEKKLVVSGSLIPEHLIFPSAAPDLSDDLDQDLADQAEETTPGVLKR